MTTAFACQRLLFIVLTGALVLAPLPFGGTALWFDSAFVVGTGAIAGLWAVTAWPGRHLQPASVRPLLPAAGLYALALSWCVAQAWLPVPDNLAHPLWREAREILGLPLASVLALDPETAIREVLRLSGYALVFFLCFQYAADERRAQTLLRAVVIAGALYSAYGIFLTATGSRTVLWYPRTFELDNLSATFPNRNAFASYAALCLLSALALLYRRRLRAADLAAGWRAAMTPVLRYFLGRTLWLVPVGLTLFVAILMTHSRAGLAAATLGGAAFLAGAAHSARLRPLASAAAAIVTAIAIALFLLAGGGTAARMALVAGAGAERLQIFAATIEAVAERPFLGTGLGSFDAVFPAYRPPALRAQIDHAHNSFLENALEMGLPGATLFYAALLAAVFPCLRALRRRVAHPWPALGIAATTLAAAHSLVDYAFQFPAVAITFAAILGAAAAQAAAPRAPSDTEATRV